MALITSSTPATHPIRGNTRFIQTSCSSTVPAAQQSLGLPQGQMIDLRQSRHRQHCRLAVGPGMAPLAYGRRVTPASQSLITDPQRQASPLHQRSVILRPVAETIPCFGLLACHTSRIPAIRLRGYLRNKATVQCIEYLAPDTLPGRGVQPVQDRFQECIGCYICAEVVRSYIHLRPHANMSQNCLQGDGRFFRRRFGILL
jgi:hypothetical protein